MKLKALESDYPCRICGCEAWMHYKSIGSGRDLCVICYSRSENIIDARGVHVSKGGNAVHEFEGDNLKFLEGKYDQSISL